MRTGTADMEHRITDGTHPLAQWATVTRQKLDKCIADTEKRTSDGFHPPQVMQTHDTVQLARSIHDRE